MWSSAFKRFLDCSYATTLLLALAPPSRYQGIFDVSAWFCVICLLAASVAASTSAGHEWQNRQGCSLPQTFFVYAASSFSFVWKSAGTNGSHARAIRVFTGPSLLFVPADSQAKERLLAALPNKNRPTRPTIDGSKPSNC